MEKVNINGRLYRVRWAYIPKNKSNTRYSTKCIISESGETIAEAIVHPSVREVISKERARMFSLGKALRELFPENKEHRRKFWCIFRAPILERELRRATKHEQSIHQQCLMLEEILQENEL